MPEKLTGLDFLETLQIVVGTERRFRYDKRDWLSYLVANNCRFAYLISTNTANEWWPSIEQQKEKIWEVEAEKPRDLFAWGVCDDDDSSYLYSEQPYKIENGQWETLECDCFVVTGQDNFFPKDKPQKFRLVPVDDATE